MDKMHISITVAAILFWNFNLTWSLNVTTTAIPETELVSVNRTELGIPPGENPGNETELVSTPTPIDPCAAGICQNGGTCIGNSSSTLGYECQCLEGWMGKNCTQKDFCSSSPCHNNGTCSQNVTGMTCHCTEDYTGELCDKAVDRCTPNPCQNNANCTNIPGDFNCSCPSGYGGKNCSLDTNLCDPNPCMNGATCIQNMMEINCTCTPGFTGQICDQEIDFCLSDPCQNNGTCINKRGGYNCTCLLGFTGNICEIDIDDCVGVTCENGGTCQDGIYTYSCLCAVGWTGGSCETDIDECATTVCDSNADCQNTAGSYNCTCRSGYSGDGHTCSFMNPCASLPCHNGMCYSELKGFRCMCNPGWQGDFCDQDVNECDEAVTIKHDCDPKYGHCENTVGSYTCTCTNNSQGDGHTCTVNILYPYHNMIVDSEDDTINSKLVPGGLPFFGEIYWNIYISTNGYITLGLPYDRQNPWNDGSLNPDVKMIAPYWTDLDLSSGSSSLYYDAYYSGQSQQTATTIFQRIKADSKKYAASNATFLDFEPSYVGIITWHQVAPFPASQYKMQNVTFQCILATDSKRSFTMFNYDRDHMFIDPASNNWTISALISKGPNNVLLWVKNIYRPDKETNQGADDAGRFVFRLGEPIINNNLNCIQWYNNQDDDMIQANMSLADPCPCSSIQAELDPRFVAFSGRPGCYKMIYTGDAWNLCCYDNETALLPSTGYSQLMLATDTTNVYDRCCTATSLCHLYYQKRPADKCQGYQPPVWGAGWGEPHFHTFDGKLYTFNGLGEFVLLSVDNSRFMLQGRTGLVSRPVQSTVNATIFTAFASQQVDMPKLELRLDPTNKDDVNIRVNGKKITTLTGLKDHINQSGIYITKSGETEISILHQNNIGYKVGLSMNALWIKISLPQKYKGQTTGLLGTFDGSAENDLMYRDGNTVLPPTANEEQIFQYGQNWTVQESESLFNYSLDDTKTYQDFLFPDFVPMWFAESLTNLSGVSGIDKNLTNSVCQSSVTCIIDYLAMGNIRFANWTKLFSEINALHGKKIMNFPPLFTNSLPSDLDIIIGQKVTLTLSANDIEQQNIQIKVNTNLDPSTYNLDNNIFQWTPSNNLTQSGTTVSLKFYAVDSLGAAALYWPLLHFCGCARGYCIKVTDMAEYVYSRDQFYSGLCQCRADSSGRYCTERHDPCQPNPCYYNVPCVSDPDSDKGYRCESCPSGTVTANGVKCYDINECLSVNNTCQHMCINQLGGYVCSCEQGYTLRSDLSSCADVDECFADDLCTGVGEYCMNIPGGYKCVCKSNFYREQNKCIAAPRRYSGQIVFKILKINDVFLTFDPEMTDVNSEKFQAVSKQVEDTVKIPYALKFQTLFKKVQVYKISEGSMVAMFDLFFDENDRVNGTELGDVLQQYFAMSGCVKDGPDCTVGPLIGVDMATSGAHDKNLCLDSRDNDCDRVSTECFSVNGKFYCQCRKGFQKWLDFTNICQDVDECADGTHDCDNNTSVCENKPGSYECSCRFGYHNQNGSCVDSCDPNPCQHGGSCVPIDNTNICMCQGNWMGPTCTDENEEAVKMRNVAIAASVTIGIICLILLVILIICCIRTRPIAENKYQSNSGVEPWTDSQPTPVRTQLRTEYEMKENGSGESLMQENTHRTSHSSSGSGYESTPGRQGVENPAYSNTGDNKQINVSGEYF